MFDAMVCKLLNRSFFRIRKLHYLSYEINHGRLRQRVTSAVAVVLGEQPAGRLPSMTASLPVAAADESVQKLELLSLLHTRTPYIRTNATL